MGGLLKGIFYPPFFLHRSITKELPPQADLEANYYIIFQKT